MRACVQHTHTHYTHTCACMAVPKPSDADADAFTPSAYSLSGLGYLQSFFRQLADPPQPLSRLQLLQFLSGFLTRDPVLRLGNGPTGDQDIKDVCPTDTHMTLTSWQANRNRVERVHACKTCVNIPIYNAMRGDRKNTRPHSQETRSIWLLPARDPACSKWLLPARDPAPYEFRRTAYPLLAC